MIPYALVLLLRLGPALVLLQVRTQAQALVQVQVLTQPQAQAVQGREPAVQPQLNEQELQAAPLQTEFQCPCLAAHRQW